MPGQLSVTLTPAAGSSTTGTLESLLTNNTAWPPSTPSGTNSVGQPVTITAKYPFRSALALFWPGTRAQQGAGLFYLPASSTDRIQFRGLMGFVIDNTATLLPAGSREARA